MQTGNFAVTAASGRKYVELWDSTQMKSQLSSEGWGVGLADLPIGGSSDQAAVAEPPARPAGELPPANVRRWTIRRKAAVVIAVASGELSQQEACRRYQLTEEEFVSWQRAFEAHGLPGLRSTRLQQYRSRSPRD